MKDEKSRESNEPTGSEGNFSTSLVSSSESSTCPSSFRIKLRPLELISTSKVVLTPESKPSDILIYAAQTPAYKEAMEQGMCLVIGRLRVARLITTEQREETLNCIHEKLEKFGERTGYYPSYLVHKLAAEELIKKGYKGQKLLEAMDICYTRVNAIRIEFQTSGRGTKYYLHFAYRLRATEKSYNEKSSTTYTTGKEETQ